MSPKRQEQPVTLVFGESETEARSAVDPEETSCRLLPMTWDALTQGPPQGITVEAVLCQASPLLPQRKGLLDLLRRAFPKAPFFSFGGRGDAHASAACADLAFDAHLVAPLAEENLRVLLTSEARLQSVRERNHESIVRIREQAEKLDLLVESAKAANSLLEPARVMQVVMDRTQEFLGAEGWSVYLLVEEGERKLFEATRGGLGRDLTTTRQPCDQGVAAWVVQHRRAASIDDLDNDPRSAADAERQTGPRLRSLLCVPLTSRGRVMGAVEVLNKTGMSGFTERDLETLRTMMEPAATAIENAILFKRLEELSITDDLTKLYNSRYLNQYLQQEVKRSKRYGFSVSLMFLDLDGFKSVNDRHGHLAGSRTLAEVGKVIRATVRETDIVSRYGGDEFTVVLPQTTAEGAVSIARRLRESLAEYVFLESYGIQVRITASIGISCYPDHGETREDLIGHADRAMYRVKERGKNGVELALQDVSA